MPKESQISVSPRSRLQQILILGRDYWDHDAYNSDSRRAFSRALRCKSPAMGGRVFASENEERVFYNTCKSPACPSCGHRATKQWQRERWCAIPDGSYLEITLTMPDTLWDMFARNPQLCRKLPGIAARVIRSYARVRHGIEVGVMPVVHTFNGELLFKPHVHSLVTAGGLQASTSRWHPRIYFDRKSLVRSWQRLIIAILREASETGQLESTIAGDDLESLLQLEETRGWIAHVRAFKGKEHFLLYCGRYVRRPPIAHWRIREIKNGLVGFWHEDTRLKRWITVQCTIEEFIDRWSKHIPQRYRHAVRHFGLFAPRRWSRVAAGIFIILEQKQRPQPKRLPWAIAIQQQFGRDPQLDKNGQPMKFVRHVAPAAG